LRATLESLKSQTYAKYKCIVIDDGSNADHLKEFRLIAEEYSSKSFEFLEQPNKDVGETRNIGAKSIETDVITFLDSDDILERDYLERLSRIDFNRRVVVTSHFTIFLEDPNNSRDSSNIVGSYEPIGSISDKSWMSNFLGGANFALNREFFLELGGFSTERNQNHQDWRFLVKAQHKGFEIIAIPYRMLRYRVSGNSMTRTRSHLEGHLGVMNQFLDTASTESKERLLEELMESMIVSKNVDLGFQFSSATERIVRKVQRIALRLTPYGSKRWNFALKFYRRLAK
jgi:glycosyltransferase involved in cell wall biosynthesis